MAYSGPWPLTHEVINEVVTDASPGTFYLGRIELRRNRRGGSTEKFIYFKIGRDDEDLNKCLHWYVGSRKFAKWGYFTFRYWPTSREAFEEEARVFHANPGPGNTVHPKTPYGQVLACPVNDDCFADDTAR